MRTRAKLTVQILITLFCIVLVLIMFEYYLRQEVTYIVDQKLLKSNGLIEQDPEMLIHYTSRGRRFVPNAKATIRNHYLSKKDIPININSLGFRAEELPQLKQPDEFRILALGDSITVGDYLELEKVYPAIEESELKKANPNKNIHVINAGIGNVGLEEEINLLEDTIAAVQPDLIQIGYYLNDTRPPWAFSGEIGNRGWLRKHSLIYETIYRNVFEQQWAAEQGKIRFAWIEAAKNLPWKTDRNALLQLASLAKYDWGAAWEDDATTILAQQLTRLKKITSQLTTKVVFIALPVSYQVYADYVEDHPQRELKEMAEKFGFGFIDVLPELRASNNDLHLFFDQCHLQEVGNIVVGRFIAQQIAHSIN